MEHVGEVYVREVESVGVGDREEVVDSSPSLRRWHRDGGSPLSLEVDYEVGD